jgi:mono/diheme cytochrome c family protein
MSMRSWIVGPTFMLLGLLLVACNPNPQPKGLTEIPTLAPGQTVTSVVVLQGSGETAGSPAPVATGQASAALGAAIYQGNCSPCHGTEGQGVDAPALRASGYVRTASNQDLLKTISDGSSSTEMPGWLQSNGGPLTEAEIDNVIAFLRTMQGLAPLPTSTPVQEPTEPAPTPSGPTPEPARPSLAGGPGPAASMTGNVDQGRRDFGQFCAVCHGPEGVQGIPNPGSDDGYVPELNPIDPTLVSSDSGVFATNIDRFVEHGSVPEGPGPLIMMPPYGDSDLLANQQIADIIAYVMYLNGNG